MKFGIDSAGSVGDDERAAAEERQHAGGEGDLGGGVALIKVHAALQHGDRRGGNMAEDEAACVADDAGGGEVRDVGIGDGG